MGRFNLYKCLASVDGDTPRDILINHNKRSIREKSLRNPSRKSVLIDDCEQDVVIVSGVNSHTKTICAMPDDIIYDGQTVVWNNSHWLISDVDIESEVYYRGTLHQCNVNLRWQNEFGDIINRWCYSEINAADGIRESTTLNLTDGNLILYLPLDVETRKLRLDRRFLVDIEVDNPTAYKLINRNVTSGIFDEERQHGIYQITLQKSERSNDRDNYELMIADYFTPKGNEPTGVNCEIIYTGKPVIKAGSVYKTFTAKFLDSDGNIINDSAIWNVAIIDEHQKYFNIINEGNVLKIKADNNIGIIGSKIKIELYNEDNSCNAELYVKVVPIL